MTAPIRYSIIAILSFIGAGISLYQSSHFFKIRNTPDGFHSFCTFGSNFNCDAVELSRWAELFPGMPLSGIAVGFFFALGLIALFSKNPFMQKDGLKVITLLSGIAVIVSLFYLYIMRVVLGQWCLFCLMVDAINIANFGIALSLKPGGLSLSKVQKPHLKKFAWTLAICIGVGLLVSKMFDRSPISADREALLFDRILSTSAQSIEIAPDSISVGPNDAPVTIIKFSDYQCPACKIGAIALHPAWVKYKDKIRFISKNYPLSPECNPMVKANMHPFACQAARIAICADQQDQFLPVYETFFENQQSLNEAMLMDEAVKAGLSRESLESCVASESTKNQLNAEIQLGNDLPIRATPTFYINGHKAEGVTPTQVWMKLIKHFLKNES